MQLLGQERDILTLDWETYYGPKYSLSLQTMNTFKYVNSPEFLIHGCGVQLNDEPTEYFDFHDPATPAAFREYIGPKRDIALLAHNTQFDGYILSRKFDYIPALYLDTMAMSRAMFVGQPANLADLAQRLWPADVSRRKLDDLKLTFGLRELPPDVAEKLKRYCLRDVGLTYEAFKLLLDHFPDDELRLIDWTVRASCDPTFVVNLDLVNEEINYQVERRTRLIRTAGVAETTLKSDPQFAQLLESRGVTVERKRNAKDTEDIPALSQKDWGYLRMQAAHPELRPIWEARKVAKSNIQESRARWIKAVAEWNDGKLPVPLNYYGADTGRWSGGEKLNLQNLPRINPSDPNSGRLRQALCAPAGSMVIVRDLNNIEGRCLAWEAGEEYLLEIFRIDGCPYLVMAERIYHATPGSFTKAANAGERNVGKVTILGLGYGMGKNKFWITLNTGPMGMDPIPFSFEQAASVVDIYRTTNTRIVNYWRQCDGIITRMATLSPGETIDFGPLEVRRGMLVMPNGLALQYPRLRGTPNRFDGTDFTFGNNQKLYGGLLTENITQALARCILAEQHLKIQKELAMNYARGQAKVVHSVHDELIAIAPEPEAEQVYAMMGEIMSTPPAWAPDLPLKSEGGIAPQYSK
jgi:DNA polymerase